MNDFKIYLINFCSEFVVYILQSAQYQKIYIGLRPIAIIEIT